MGVRVIRPKRQIDGVSEAFQQDEVEGSEAEDLGGLSIIPGNAIVKNVYLHFGLVKQVN
jgi:hypothetical protein